MEQSVSNPRTLVVSRRRDREEIEMGIAKCVVVGAAGALIGLVACGPSPTPLKGPNAGPGGPSTEMGSDDAYAGCKDQEKLGDASTCWKKWLVDYGNTGETPQKDYAKMYIRRNPSPGPQPGPGPTPAPTPTPSEVRVIPFDSEQERREATGNHGGSSVQWPPKSVGEKECWDHMKLTGKYVDDYNELVGRCGRPTGMLAYSKPVHGELSQSHKGDVFTIKLVGGGCYRIFAVADGGVKDLDVAIATMQDKVVWVDKNQQSVAVVDWEKAICIEKDVQFKFIVALDGAGAGEYALGIWVRPGPS